MHEGQFRHSGEPYFTHPVSVAAILTEQQLDDATIITALLHDTIEDTAHLTRVSELFGEKSPKLVDGVTKLTNLQLIQPKPSRPRISASCSWRCPRTCGSFLVKLADRLHNMRTIKSMRPEKQAQKARETMDIFAPLAGRMGMQWMREELEDLAFRVSIPKGAPVDHPPFITLQRETGDVIQRITGDMRHELEKAGIEAEVFGAPRNPIRSGARCRKRSSLFAASRHLRVSDHHRQ